MSALPILQDEPVAEPLPELQDAVISTAELEVLFADLASHAEIGAIVLKGAATERAAGTATLEDAQAALVAGTVRGVQIRYRFDGTGWWDTLLCVPGGFRVVRMER